MNIHNFSKYNKEILIPQLFISSFYDFPCLDFLVFMHILKCISFKINIHSANTEISRLILFRELKDIIKCTRFLLVMETKKRIIYFLLPLKIQVVETSVKCWNNKDDVLAQIWMSQAERVRQWQHRCLWLGFFLHFTLPWTPLHVMAKVPGSSMLHKPWLSPSAGDWFLPYHLPGVLLNFPALCKQGPNKKVHLYLLLILRILGTLLKNNIDEAF